MIFNYGYGCCAFVHNICGSEPMVPDRMPDMSKPLPLEFFINPRCPSGTIPIEAAAAPEADISEMGERLPAAEVVLGNQFDSPAKVTGDSEEPDAFGEI